MYQMKRIEHQPKNVKEKTSNAIATVEKKRGAEVRAREKSGTYGIGQQLQTKNPSIREAQKA